MQTPQAKRSSSSTAPSSSAAPPAGPPVFLQLDERSFAHLTLSTHNFFHIYVGRVGARLMVLPLVLHLHPTLVSAPAAAVLGRLFTRLPALIAEVNVASLKTGKEQLHVVDTDQTAINPSQPRLSHPAIDSEEDEAERGGVMGDGRHRSDDEEEEGLGMDDDEDDELGELSDEQEDDADVYRGGKYRAFHVSKHTLYVRAIARHPDGLRDDTAEDDQQRLHPQPESSPQASKRSAAAVGRDSQAKDSPSKSPNNRAPPPAIADFDDDDFI